MAYQLPLVTKEVLEAFEERNNSPSYLANSFLRIRKKDHGFGNFLDGFVGGDWDPQALSAIVSVYLILEESGPLPMVQPGTQHLLRQESFHSLGNEYLTSLIRKVESENYFVMAYLYLFMASVLKPEHLSRPSLYGYRLLELQGQRDDDRVVFHQGVPHKGMILENLEKRLKMAVEAQDFAYAAFWKERIGQARKSRF